MYSYRSALSVPSVYEAVDAAVEIGRLYEVVILGWDPEGVRLDVSELASRGGRNATIQAAVGVGAAIRFRARVVCGRTFSTIPRPYGEVVDVEYQCLRTFLRHAPVRMERMRKLATQLLGEDKLYETPA